MPLPQETLTAPSARKASKSSYARSGKGSLLSTLRSSLAGVWRSIARSRTRQLLLCMSLLLLYALTQRHTAWDGSRTSKSPAGSTDDDRIPGVHKVERDVLEKLKKLERHLGKQAEAARESVRKEAAKAGITDLVEEDEEDKAMVDPDEMRYLNLRVTEGQQPKPRDQLPMPRVDRIPEPIKPVKAPPPSKEILNPNPLVAAAELDALYCPTQKSCKFIVPGFIGEQETKAQEHLYQLGLLAAALNRTVVLPNLIRSRLGTCYANPFSFYYSQDALNDLGMPSISQAQFIDWANQRDPSATAQIVSMSNPKADYPTGAIEIDSTSDPTLVPGKPDRKLCLQPPKSFLNFTHYSPLAVFPPESWHKLDETRLAFGESVINTLRSDEVYAKSSRSALAKLEDGSQPTPDVLVLNY